MQQKTNTQQKVQQTTANTSKRQKAQPKTVLQWLNGVLQTNAGRLSLTCIPYLTRKEWKLADRSVTALEKQAIALEGIKDELVKVAKRM